MLSDEERKAIEDLKDMIEKSKDLMEEEFYKLATIHNIQAVATVLNLIEKQSKEIEELNLKNEKLYEDNLTLAQEIKEFIEGTNDVKYYSTSFIKNHYISKDKIKAKIEEYDEKGMTINLANRSAGKTFQQAVHYEVKKILQSLLEKE